MHKVYPEVRPSGENMVELGHEITECPFECPALSQEPKANIRESISYVRPPANCVVGLESSRDSKATTNNLFSSDAEPYEWVYSKRDYAQTLEVLSFSIASISTTSLYLKQLTYTRYGASGNCRVPLPAPLFNHGDKDFSQALLDLNFYVQDGQMFDGIIPRYQPRKDRLTKLLIPKSQNFDFFCEVARSAVFIRSEQFFEDANHRSAMLFIMECCYNSGIVLQKHPFEIYIIISNLHEVPWHTVVVELTKWLRKSSKSLGDDECRTWRSKNARLIKEVPFWNSLIRYAAYTLNGGADYDARKLLAMRLKKMSPRFYRWGLWYLDTDFHVRR